MTYLYIISGVFLGLVVCAIWSSLDDQDDYEGDSHGKSD